MGDNSTKFRERIARALEYLGKSNDELAHILGVNRNTVSAYRAKKGDLKGVVLSNLASKFGFSPVWLLTGDGEMFVGREDQRTEAGVDAMDAIRDNADFSITEDDDAGAAPVRRAVSQEEAAYRAERIPRGQEPAAIIIQLLARILAAGRPKHVDMVVLYLRNITALIEDDAGEA